MRSTNIMAAVIFMLLGCSSREQVVDKDSLLGNDYRLFQETPLWDLAKAVWDKDTSKIKRIAKMEKVNLNYPELKFGSTLLMLTVLNEDYSSCKALLELGADPNKHDTYNGSSAIIDAARINGVSDDNTSFLKLLLKYGANPNDEETGKRPEGNTTRKTPLLTACGSVNRIISPIKKVKVLVDAGANVNYKNEFGQTPLKEALLLEHYDIVSYFLKKGADFTESITNRDGKEYYIADILREVLLPLDSEDYKYKMEIVEYLKEKGIDYRKIPIPDYVVKEAKETYRTRWKEYLEKY